MGGGSVPKVPDYKIYRYEDVPELKEHQEKLAGLGLKDPWLRNEVWRYNRRGKMISERRVILRSLFGWPFLLAIPAGYVTSLLVKKFFKYPVDPRIPPVHHDH